MYFGDLEGRIKAYEDKFPELSFVQLNRGVSALTRQVERFYGNQSKYLASGELRDDSSD